MISEIVLEEKLNNEDGSEGFLHNRSHEEEQLQMGKCAMYSKGLAEPFVAPPRFGLYHLRGRTGELRVYSTPGALFPPRDFGSSCPSLVAFRFFQALAKEKGCSGSFILANILCHPLVLIPVGSPVVRRVGLGLSRQERG